MGITFSKNLKKCKSKNGYRWISTRRFVFKKAIPRIRTSKKKRYTLRSVLSRSLES